MVPRQRHGRKGQRTEYYEYDFPSPKFITQKVSERWIVGYAYQGVIRMGRTLYPNAEVGQTAARRFAREFLQQFQRMAELRCASMYDLLDDLLKMYDSEQKHVA